MAAQAAPLGREFAALATVGGRRLAAPVVAGIDAPRRDCAAMDGYAVRSADLVAGITRFREAGTSFAGTATMGELRRGDAWRIMTGAALPDGADRVVMIERCQAWAEGIEVDADPAGKPHVRLQGSDFRAGDVLLHPGALLTPAALVAAAAADVGRVELWRQPNVLLLSTGDEIAAPGTARSRSHLVPDSLGAAIAHLCRSAGAVAPSLLRVGDAPDLIAGACAATDCDVIVVIGGASRGDRDHGRAALASIGLDMAFADVAMKPGKPAWYGRLDTRHVIGLPGNPTAALTVARLFLVPLITGLSGGNAKSALRWRMLGTRTPLQANGPRESFLCAEECIDGVAVFGDQDASGQRRLARSTSLVRRPANAPAIASGSQVPTLDL
ncbi:molybdopterin molybdochelatase [Sphingopyxis sp. YR583]|nr:molybdopterin molybdochelatase [Sphingopyxis sp. YR583]